MRILLFHPIFALLSEFRSPLGIPANLHYWDATLFRSFDLSAHSFDRFFHEVEVLIDFNLIERDYKGLVG